jgi:Cu-processing system ATP-binding protein
MTQPIIELSQVCKQYREVLALNHVSLTVAPGEVIGLLGHNGAGKSTLMKILLGVISPTKGSVKVLGFQPDTTEAWHARRYIGYLPENVSFYEQLSGLDVLTYFAKLKGFQQSDAKALLEQVGITHAMKRPVKTYSKGMRQRLGLAQALLGEPHLLLLDEPTTGLDPNATMAFYDTIAQLKKQGTSIVLCSHVLPGIERHIDRALIMSHGHALACGTLEQLRQQANLPTIIKPDGINGFVASHPKLSKFWQSQSRYLTVPEAEKITVLRQLIAIDELENLTMESASLERLYQHFVSHSANQQPKDIV